MTNLRLTMAFSDNPRSRPVLDGRIKPDGIDLDIEVLTPADIFLRQLHTQEFDVSEMSLSSLLIVTARGDSPWVALPIFTMRQCFHTWAWVRADAGIERPEDLRGKRVGVPEYQQTAALWSRGVLQHEFGVAPEEMEWFMERTPERSHGGATGFTPPPGIRFHQIPASANIGDMMMAGELDATLLYLTRQNLTDRSRVQFEGNPKVRTLFPDVRAENARYFQKTGIFPINHGVVVRRSILERYPWVGLNLFNAFRLAKEDVLREARSLAATHETLGLLSPGGVEGLSVDPFPYGVRSNKHVLETIATYSHEQGLTPRVLDFEEIFWPATLDL